MYEGIIAGVWLFVVADCDFMVAPLDVVSLLENCENEDVDGRLQDPNAPANVQCADSNPWSCQRTRKSRVVRPSNTIKHHWAALRMPLEAFMVGRDSQ